MKRSSDAAGRRWTAGRLILWMGIAVLVFIAGFLVARSPHQPIDQRLPSRQESSTHDHSSTQTLWTCSMHPQILLPQPGKCPICFMDLIPIKTDSGDKDSLHPREIRLSETAAKLAGIRTVEVKRGSPRIEGRLIGKVGYDETRLGTITAWMAGRIDRLFVSYTGAFVKKGQEMAEIYSPELYAAQSELIEAVKAAPGFSESRLDMIRNSAARTVKAAREKLRLLGLNQDQINSVIKRGMPSDHITLHAPLSGVVTKREVTEGMYLRTGSPIYTIADISRVWVILEGYESDLPRLKIGTEIEFTSEAMPGKIFSGKIAYIDPFVNEKTRTAAVRVEAENPGYTLKPGMYVKAVYRFDLSGYLKSEPPLLVPAEAPLITGKRAVVYVAAPEKEGVYEGREIVLGPRGGEYYVVEKGLKEGEMVVARGAFKLDSSLQIQAKPSMMGEGGAPSPTGHIHTSPSPTPETHSGHAAAEQEPEKPLSISPVFKQQLGKAVLSYTLLAEALAADKDKDARKSAEDVLKALASVEGSLLPATMQKEWETILESIKDSVASVRKGSDIAGTRKAFDIISKGIIAAVTKMGADAGKPLFELFCPMAFDNRGAFWLQTDQEIRNPYFGAQMLSCGEVRRKLSRDEN